MALAVFAIGIVLLAVGVFLTLVFNPDHKVLNLKNRALELEVDNLKQEIAKKDKELEVRRLGLPWVDTE